MIIVSSAKVENRNIGILGLCYCLIRFHDSWGAERLVSPYAWIPPRTQSSCNSRHVRPYDDRIWQILQVGRGSISSIDELSWNTTRQRICYKENTQKHNTTYTHTHLFNQVSVNNLICPFVPVGTVTLPCDRSFKAFLRYCGCYHGADMRSK